MNCARAAVGRVSAASLVPARAFGGSATLRGKFGSTRKHKGGLTSKRMPRTWHKGSGSRTLGRHTRKGTLWHAVRTRRARAFALLLHFISVYLVAHTFNAGCCAWATGVAGAGRLLAAARRLAVVCASEGLCVVDAAANRWLCAGRGTCAGL